MPGSKLYYIYLDTKIVGAVEQLISYFQAQVFNKNDCIHVLCKFYKEIEKEFSKRFELNDIPYKFLRKQSELVLEKDKTVFYLFNAQSNCRVVANRNLTHIFVTHGESHKPASTKPIIRIYDYVITSGKVGIERYLKSGIFTPYDIESGRLITLGDTFLGDNNFIYDQHSTAIVYAPTWEGGVPEENYCSLSLKNAYRIVAFCKKRHINTIHVKPHPNIGHRDTAYKEVLNHTINIFQREGLVTFGKKIEPISLWRKLFRFPKGNSIPPSSIPVRYAITDISAMEMQFINKKIPCMILINDASVKKLSIPNKLNEYYARVLVPEDCPIKYDAESEFLLEQLYEYLLTYPSPDISEKSVGDRVKWLCQHTKAHLKEKNNHLISQY